LRVVPDLADQSRLAASALTSKIDATLGDAQVKPPNSEFLISGSAVGTSLQRAAVVLKDAPSNRHG
jgi:hypothetical protein